VTKAIVTPQSGVMARLVRKADLVATAQPTSEDNGASHEYKTAPGSIEIPYVDRNLVKQVMRFLYTGTYNTSEWNKNKKDAQAIPVAMGLYAISQKFEIPSPEDKIIRNLAKLLSYDWEAGFKRDDYDHPIRTRPKMHVVVRRSLGEPSIPQAEWTQSSTN
jgi:hypothetical protein